MSTPCVGERWLLHPRSSNSALRKFSAFHYSHAKHSWPEREIFFHGDKRWEHGRTSSLPTLQAHWVGYVITSTLCLPRATASGAFENLATQTWSFYRSTGNVLPDDGRTQQ